MPTRGLYPKALDATAKNAVCDATARIMRKRLCKSVKHAVSRLATSHLGRSRGMSSTCRRLWTLSYVSGCTMHLG